jgi:3-hydroxybutyrate dehydrogenase
MLRCSKIGRTVRELAMAVDFGLQGQVAIVTGSTSGIGHAMADALAAQGVNIVLNGLGEMTAIEKTRAELAEKHGVEVLYNGADMTKPGQIAEMVAAAKAEFGELDILVNNAGVQHVAPIEDFPVEQWDLIIAINLSSAFHATRAAIPIMKEQGRGRIVNIASAHGLVASPFKAAYVAAKHGILGLTKTVALETGHLRHHLQRHLPGLREDPAGRGPDRRPGQGPGDLGRGGDEGRDPGRPADQAIRHLRPAERPAAVPGLRRRRLGQRLGLQHRRRLDGAVAFVH